MNEYSKIYISRHSDGYPGNIIPDLRDFIDWVKTVTNNSVRFGTPSQFAGWLIIWGRATKLTTDKEIEVQFPDLNLSYNDWKVGDYEPIDGLHRDINYVYKIEDGEIFYSETPRELWDAEEDGITNIEDNIDWKHHKEWIED